MVKFLKAQFASLSGTIIDFSTTIVSVEVFGLWYVTANIAGNILGGLTNFMLGRIWVFQARGEKVYLQAVRYIIVWVGNIILNTSGVFILTHYMNISYIYSKVIISLFVGIGWNYLLQKYFVFKNRGYTLKN